jgi:hypothetical protein
LGDANEYESWHSIWTEEEIDNAFKEVDPEFNWGGQGG